MNIYFYIYIDKDLTYMGDNKFMIHSFKRDLNEYLPQ